MNRALKAVMLFVLLASAVSGCAPAVVTPENSGGWSRTHGGASCILPHNATGACTRDPCGHVGLCG